MKKLGKILKKLFPWVILFGVIGWLVWDYSQREYWVYLENDPAIHPGVVITLDRTVYDKKYPVLTYTMHNHAEAPACWGAELGGRIEQWTEEGWRYRERRNRKDMVYPAIEYVLNVGETQTGQIDLRALPRWEKGRYRFIHYFTYGPDTYTCSYQEFTVE